MSIEDKFPHVYYRENGTYLLTFIDNYKSKDVILHERDFCILMKSIGESLERRYRPADLVEHDRRCAI